MDTSKPLVVIGFLGTTMDNGQAAKRWDKWRPTIDLCRHDDLQIARIELLHDPAVSGLARSVAEDIKAVSPDTQVRSHHLALDDPWDFGEVYAALADFAQQQRFDPDVEDYLVHITTGTHVAQICLFLLTESRHIPGRLLQSMPPKRWGVGDVGGFQVIDLDLSRYDQLAARRHLEQQQATSFLKAGIATKNAAFNALIDDIEHVATSSTAPLLLLGPTGAGKTRLSRRLYDLKRLRHLVKGRYVEVNCATIRGDGAMSTLFGHTKGAFTGAVGARDGLLRAAHGGVLFLDEVGELGLDEQAMLLRAIEDKTFTPVGSDVDVKSDFQLVAGTNRDLRAAVVAGTFRDDLLARLDLWTFTLPGLAERREDIAPNLDFELERVSTELRRQITFSTEAKARFLAFATSTQAPWPGNFRELGGAVTRLATLAAGGRITEADVDREVSRLQQRWQTTTSTSAATSSTTALTTVLSAEQLATLDRFDAVQLADVVGVCRQSKTLSEAGRTLFAASRLTKTSSNDADRLRKYLAGHGLTFNDVIVSATSGAATR
ncbi:MAG TPA: RNA repair transcriptional activator RtcR [Myxococcota bacterium]